MFKKLLLIIFLTIFLASCVSVQENIKEKIGEINETLKGDGTPYIPGI